MHADTVSALFASHDVECRAVRRVTTGKFNSTFACDVTPGAVVLDEVRKYLVIWTLRAGGGRVESYRRYALDMLRRLNDGQSG